MKFPPSEFWSFSTELYQHPEVEQACLKMQDNYHADINILLFCCWIGDKQIQLSENEVQTLIKTSQPWQANILTHLRAARHTLKTSQVIIPDELREETRKNICEMELNAERMAQLALEKAINLKKRAVNRNISTIDCIKNNLQLYCNLLDQQIPVTETDIIVEAFFQTTQQPQSQIASN